MASSIEVRETVFVRKVEQQVVLDNRPAVLQWWIVLWLMVSGVICTVDVIYTMNRPYTNDPTNDVSNFLFKPWIFYSSVDRHYATTDDIVTQTTGRVMLIECVLNFVAVGLALARSRHAVLIAFSTTVMVLWKTIIYFTVFIKEPYRAHSGFNINKGIFQKFMIFWVPNGFWIVMPCMVILGLWNKLALPPKVAEKYWDNYNKCQGQIPFKKDN